MCHKPTPKIGILMRIAALSVVLLLSAPAVAADKPQNELVITITGGPHAGTFRPDATLLICLTVKARGSLGLGFKDFNAKDPKALVDGGMDALEAATSGTKVGNVRVAFADNKIYEASGTNVKLVREGKGGTMTFEGKVADAALKVVATCRDVEQM